MSTFVSVKDYVIVPNFLDDNMVESLLKLYQNKPSSDSRVGTRVDPKQKRRKDVFLSGAEGAPIDKIIFSKGADIIEKEFGYGINRRETWKIGYYSHEDQGFYNPHTDTQGGMNHRVISCVIGLSRNDEYEGGRLEFPNLKKKFHLDRGEAIFFKSSVLHGVNPVTGGHRYTLISFFFDSEKRDGPNYKPFTPPKLTPVVQPKPAIPPEEEEKFLIALTPDSGPGNQIVGIKESLIMATILGRVPVICPIVDHYTKGRSNIWRFDKIFNYANKWLPASQGIISQIKNKMLMHPHYEQPLVVEKILRMARFPQCVSNQRNFNKVSDIKKLETSEKIMCLKHVFNNVKIQTHHANGVFKDPFNIEFRGLYENICQNLDFSDFIKDKAKNVLKILGENFIAVHMRYPDCMGSANLASYGVYTEEDVTNALSRKFATKKVFIATNNIRKAKASTLRNFTFYEEPGDIFASFVEQYICCMSETFILSPYNDFTRINGKTRSTWSSFVGDYRHFRSMGQSDLTINDLVT